MDRLRIVYTGSVNEQGENIAHYLCRTGGADELIFLHDVINNDNRHCLMEYNKLWQQCVHVVASVHKDAVEKMKLLALWGADLNGKTFNDGCTPLHIAVKVKNYELAEWLCQQPNFNREALNDENMTPYHIAFISKDEEMMKILKKNGVQCKIPLQSECNSDDEDYQPQCLYVNLRGKCDVHWTSLHSWIVNGRTVYYTKNHDSHEEYVNTKLYLMGSRNGQVQLDPGQHLFSFQLVLPPNCPSSFEGDDGNIRYYLKFVIDRAFRFDQKREFPITVLGRRDLNAHHFTKEPIEMAIEESYCCWCVSSGIFELQARVQASGFCPGQTLRCDVKCENKSNVKFNYVKFEIIEIKQYIAIMHPDTRHVKTVIAMIKKGPIPGGVSRFWNVELEIPELTVHNLDSCNYIRINYEFKVTVDPSGCHTITDESRRILIGNIPLREFEDDIPTLNQTSQLIAHYPAQAQPCSAYARVNSLYASVGLNPHYPGVPSNDPCPPYPGPTVSVMQPQPPPSSQLPSAPDF